MSMENVLVFKFSVDMGLIVKEINYGIDKYYMENEVVASPYYYSFIESKIIYGEEKKYKLHSSSKGSYFIYHRMKMYISEFIRL